jgi:type IV secretory pathway VirB4 component
MSWFVYPADESAIQSVLKRRSTQLRAQISTDMTKWRTYDAEVDVESRDVENIRQKLATREERYFEWSWYTTLYQHDEEKLREESKKFEQKVSWYGIRIKSATYRMDEAQISTMPPKIEDI